MKLLVQALSLSLVILVLASCGTSTQFATGNSTATPVIASETPVLPTDTPLANNETPALPTNTRAIPTFTLSPTPTQTPLPPAALVVEEHALEGINGIILEDVLAKHADQRGDDLPHTGIPVKLEVNGNTISRTTNTTIVRTDDQGNKYGIVDVIVSQNETPILTIPVGPVDPVAPVRGFWSVNGSWFLEVAQIPNEPDEPHAVGDIYHDGESLNQREGYEESFGFQTIYGEPFYFYKRNGEYGYFYRRQETALGYTKITHYACCSGAAGNPVSSNSMVAIHAMKGSQRYYTEIGAFD